MQTEGRYSSARLELVPETKTGVRSGVWRFRTPKSVATVEMRAHCVASVDAEMVGVDDELARRQIMVIDTAAHSLKW